ncbi:hypothetical protein TWF696_004994 [Orbilia brochopaga]|uniref:Peptidase S1 domain-containing protein n=1 Tax=Orbilia brochopaga TaxID=3140254 RepID=A0AAV9V1Q5_9PEZI
MMSFVAIVLSVVFCFTNPVASIVGGTDAVLGDVPWIGSVFISGKYSCAGVIVSGRSILTAASCVYGREASPTSFSVGFGSTDRTKARIITVQKIARHSEFNELLGKDSVAILYLASSIPYNPTTCKPIPYTSSSLPEGSEAMIAGWGATSDIDNTFPKILQKTNVIVQGEGTCTGLLGKVVESNEICVASTTGDGVACQGDVGGPVTSNDMLYGIIGKNYGCGTRNDAIIDIAEFRGWIASNA